MSFTYLSFVDFGDCETGNKTNNNTDNSKNTTSNTTNNTGNSISTWTWNKKNIALMKAGLMLLYI